MARKPKLQTLELSISSVDDEVCPKVLQPLIDALCSSIAGATVSKLVLDMDLSSDQVTQLCQSLTSSSSNVRSLHFQHLSCQWHGLQALTALISSGNLTGLDLSGCWVGASSSPEKNCKDSLNLSQVGLRK